MRPTILEAPTAAMLAAVADKGTEKIVSFFVEENLKHGYALDSCSMHIELNTRMKEPKSGGPPAAFYRGMKIAPMPYAGFRKIHATDDPFIHRLMSMQGKVPNDLVLVVTDNNHGYMGWAKKDFNMDPFAVAGAL